MDTNLDGEVGIVDVRLRHCLGDSNGFCQHGVGVGRLDSGRVDIGVVMRRVCFCLSGFEQIRAVALRSDRAARDQILHFKARSIGVGAVATLRGLFKLEILTDIELTDEFCLIAEAEPFILVR